MSDSEQADLVAFRELEHLVHHLGEELATFRRRALQAEARIRELEEHDERPMSRPRVAELERENVDLRARLDAAAVRARQMLQRLHFLRQQHALVRGSDK